MVKFENISIIGIFVLMSIVANDAKTVSICDVHGKRNKVFTKHFENGIYHPERAYDIFKIEQTVHKIIFVIIPHKLTTPLVSAKYTNAIDTFNLFMDNNRPNDRVYLIGFAGFFDENVRLYVNQLIATHFEFNENQIFQIMDCELSHELFVEYFSTSVRSHDTDIRNELEKLIALKPPKSTISTEITPTDTVVPIQLIQLDSTNIELRIYDPIGDINFEIIPLTFFGDDYKKEKSYSYAKQFPKMATAIFISHEETFVDILVDKLKKDSFDEIAKDLAQKTNNTHLILFGAFKFSFRHIKCLAQMIFFHYGKAGQPHNDVYLLGEGMFDTIFFCGHRFKQAIHQKLLEFRNAIHRSSSPKCIDLVSPTKMTEPSFKHIEISTLNGIYTPNEHFCHVTYTDFMRGKPSLPMLIIHGDIYDRIIATQESEIRFIEIIQHIETSLDRNFVVMICRNFKDYDVHLAAEFLLGHAHDSQFFVGIMAHGIFKQLANYGFASLTMDVYLGNFLAQFSN